MLVLQPDVLLSGTRIAGSFKCLRQAVLEERFGGEGNAKAVEGTLLHDLLQVCYAQSLPSCTAGGQVARLTVLIDAISGSQTEEFTLLQLQCMWMVCMLVCSYTGCPGG
jgi:hypothetical protein